MPTIVARMSVPRKLTIAVCSLTTGPGGWWARVPGPVTRAGVTLLVSDCVRYTRNVSIRSVLGGVPRRSATDTLKGRGAASINDVRDAAVWVPETVHTGVTCCLARSWRPVPGNLTPGAGSDARSLTPLPCVASEPIGVWRASLAEDSPQSETYHGHHVVRQPKNPQVDMLDMPRGREPTRLYGLEDLATSRKS